MMRRLLIGMLLLGVSCAAALGQNPPVVPPTQNPPVVASPNPPLPVPVTPQPAADSSAPVQLDAIHPLTQYPSQQHRGYDLLLVGKNFAPKPELNTIEVVGRGPETVITSDDCDKAILNEPADDQKPCLEVPKGLETQELKLVGFRPDKYSGPTSMRVHTGKNVSQAVKVTLSRIAAPLVLLAALVVFFGLAWIVIRLVSKDVKEYRISGKAYGPFTGFFLDKETNSFSLSKFQLLAWTAVSVFGYVYLFACRTLVQWDLSSFPPIPDNLPQLLAISAGTTVAATGITKSVGSKGAGNVQPSFADFVSTGGLVVGERFQFFVWTLVGCLGFVSLLLMTDPSTLKDLPKVPDGFLYLMGVSSAGYLGGKVVRKPGPVIKMLCVSKVAADQTQLGVTPPAGAITKYPAMIINLKGENMEQDAMLQIDGRTLNRADDFWISGTPDAQTHFCSDVTVCLNNVLEKGYSDGEHTLAFVNQDGQAASVTFPIDALSIEAIENMPAGTAPPTSLKVTGKNFAKELKFEWRTPANADAATASGVIVETQVISKTELTIAIGAKMQGSGKLTLISALGLRASKEHKIS